MNCFYRIFTSIGKWFQLSTLVAAKISYSGDFSIESEHFVILSCILFSHVSIDERQNLHFLCWLCECKLLNLVPFDCFRFELNKNKLKSFSSFHIVLNCRTRRQSLNKRGRILSFSEKSKWSARCKTYEYVSL